MGIPYGSKQLANLGLNNFKIFFSDLHRERVQTMVFSQAKNSGVHHCICIVSCNLLQVVQPFQGFFTASQIGQQSLKNDSQGCGLVLDFSADIKAPGESAFHQSEPPLKICHLHSLI